MPMTEVDDDCTSCRVIGGVVPMALSGYTLHSYYKNVVGTTKNVFSHGTYLTLAGGKCNLHPFLSSQCGAMAEYMNQG